MNIDCSAPLWAALACATAPASYRPGGPDGTGPPPAGQPCRTILQHSVTYFRTAAARSQIASHRAGVWVCKLSFQPVPAAGWLLPGSSPHTLNNCLEHECSAKVRAPHACALSCGYTQAPVFSCWHPPRNGYAPVAMWRCDGESPLQGVQAGGPCAGQDCVKELVRRCHVMQQQHLHSYQACR